MYQSNKIDPDKPFRSNAAEAVPVPDVERIVGSQLWKDIDYYIWDNRYWINRICSYPRKHM